MKRRFQSLFLRIRQFIRTQRGADTARDRRINYVLMSAFPFLLVLLTELNHLQSLSSLWEFVRGGFGVFCFDVLALGLVFMALTAAVKHAWIAAAGLSGFFYALSCVEFFKFDVSGSHFLPPDMALAGNLNDVAGMAKLHLTAYLVIDFFILLSVVFVLWMRNCHVSMRPSRRGITAAVCLICAAAMVVTPLSGILYGVFGVDHREAVSTFMANAKFKRNRLLAFWASELSQIVLGGISEPDNYSAEAVAALLAEVPDEPFAPNPAAHNVVVIMGESYADFRKLASDVGNAPYSAFDVLSSEGISGTAVVPTFGGYTARSEFELLTGLPVAALKDPIEPHREIERESVAAIPALFSKMGYKTIYLHPYTADFYDRNTVYPTFGFDALLFEDAFAIDDRTRYGRAVDAVCFEKIVELLESTEEPTFLFAATMQNHQPYYYEAESGKDEMAFYMEGIAETDRALQALKDAVDTLREPTILLYVGDHYPFFGLDGNFYEQNGYGEENYAALYRQSYVIYANYELSAAAVPETELSLFYLPHLLISLAVPESVPEISAAMLCHAQTVPVYTTACDTDERLKDLFLDTLTYDRVIGAGYSVR
ncbi:MAG: sulfatase-like hydrolase/transferase [Clostridia bacterium]|nr:sulfatase-like hydrolase/transferase [Clostridia bacterium]